MLLFHFDFPHAEERKKYKGAHACLFIFDILYYNGRSLLNDPLIERRKLLESVITPVHGHVEVSRAYIMRSADELRTLMNEAIEKKLEGELFIC